MKYDSLGNIKWVRKFNGVGVNNRSDISYTISIDNNGSVILSGNSGLSNNHSGIVTVKYSVITNSFNNNFNKENLKFILFQNYPNPFNPTTTISLSIKDRGNVKLDIFNLEGKKVKNIIYKKFESGDYNIKFDGSDLATGIYFYSLLINNIVIDTKKMILLK
ncbi:MAG: T9SS type A sorting domain-containing protein [Ignavibacteria bacterium]|nr:T9SS type A sorting domain-containing protein [Ignavibacteria bacterium]